MKPLDRERLELALEAAGLGEFEWDISRDVIVRSPRAAAITGLPVGETPSAGGELFRAAIHPDDMAMVARQREENLKSGHSFDVEFRIVPQGQPVRWLRSSGVIERDKAGKAQAMCGVLQDITAFKIEEEQRRTLMVELDHRVKNVLATVQSLAIQTARRTTSVEGFMANFTGRLKAMAAANELLTAARWRGAAIEHLAAAELGALAPGQASWSGPELFLTPRAANALSLALHELSANALKYGALSAEAGQVAVTWRRLEDGGFELKWVETGGPRVTAPARHGFGSTLLEQVTGRELNGSAQVDYRPGGVTASLVASAAAVAPRPETLPQAPVARAAETFVSSSGPADLRGARVLIVEDAVLLALELETGLSEAGAHVIGPAYELSEALALLDRPIDAAVLDANLNGHSVMPVAEALAARGVPFVFATGYGETGVAPGGFDAPVIRKPYDVTQVAAAVAELLKAG